MKTNKILFVAFVISAILNIILASRVIYLQDSSGDFEYIPVSHEEITTIEQDTEGSGNNSINMN